jgi:glutathione peroxidase
MLSTTSSSSPTAVGGSGIYDIPVETIDGRPTTLGEHRGKVLLIVNTASECGFTPQYEGLEQLYRTHRDAGLVVVGFPCNQFAGQEPGGEAEIKSFCERRFHVTFPMMAKIEVNGKRAHPLYRLLKAHAPGALGSEGIKWNFTKFLVGRDGRVLKRFAPTTKPADLEPEVVAALAAPAS